jgi:hypothetical protein
MRKHESELVLISILAKFFDLLHKIEIAEMLRIADTVEHAVKELEPDERKG